MSSNVREAYVYIFKLLEKYSTQDYIKIAIKKYLKDGNETLLKETEFSEELFAVERTNAGKPYFPKFKDVGFSVSHSGEYIVCALTLGNIGVDIEQKKRLQDEGKHEYPTRLIKIAERFFHRDEADLIKNRPETGFYEIFTAKESYVKLTGTGFDETLGENSVLPQDDTMPSCHACMSPVRWRSKAASFWQTLIDDYVLCICTEEECFPQIRYCSEK